MTDKSGHKPEEWDRPSMLSHIIAGTIVGLVEAQSRKSRARGRTGQPDEKQPPGRQKLVEHHRKIPWVHWAVCLLGIWLPVGPATFSYGLQPVVAGHWCTLCLPAAAIMLPMIPPETDEVVIAARRVKHFRFKNFDPPEKIPHGTTYASLVESDVPIIAQHTRRDSRRAENALLSTIAFGTD